MEHSELLQEIRQIVREELSSILSEQLESSLESNKMAIDEKLRYHSLLIENLSDKVQLVYETQLDVLKEVRR